MIEISGIAATFLLLAPFAVLAIVVWRATRLRRPEPQRPAQAGANEIVTAAERQSAPSTKESTATAAKLGDEGTPEKLYLTHAREASAAGDLNKATALLRQCIMSAQRAGNAAVHADARLDLAEIARAAGDLTTACEHWQMARRLFHDLSRKDRLAEADALMLRHGCPTDWVLTDF